MPKVRTQTFIQAPPERCFDLARDVGVHAATAEHTGERVIYAPSSGLLELGDEVEFEARHLGIRQRLRSKIVEFERPKRFVDRMQRGAFRRMTHLHEFRPENGGTLMIDELEFASPFGFVGTAFDALFLAGYMRRFLDRRSQELKRIAES